MICLSSPGVRLIKHHAQFIDQNHAGFRLQLYNVMNEVGALCVHVSVCVSMIFSSDLIHAQTEVPKLFFYLLSDSFSLSMLQKTAKHINTRL